MLPCRFCALVPAGAGDVRVRLEAGDGAPFGWFTGGWRAGAANRGCMAELPSGTVTFLFTDLEGSTRLWEEQPDAMRDALARHDAILRTAVESHRGHLVKMTGDGVHAAFTTPRDAVGAAVAAQRALAAEPWGETGPLWVRMGIHTGEAQYRDGDYYGTAVNRAARVMSAAHGGQIVLSQATADLLLDDLSGLDLVDLGEHRLRDLSRAERLYQIAATGLERDFPRLRSLDAFPGNLPQQVTSFVGRVDEIKSVTVAFEEARLVTLTGVGGVGKTRLALQAAADLLPEHSDGGWFCELAVAGDPDAMTQVVASALGIQARPELPLDARIRQALRERRLLLVLDNCEHLLDAASRLASEIMRECPDVRILATSREPLGVDGERVVRVRSLPVPDAAAVARGDESDAMRLFDDRANSVEPHFQLDVQVALIVAEICRRLDGIPLAIELAAARVVSMSPTEILELLDERFRLLTGGRRTAMERHQTLRATTPSPAVPGATRYQLLETMRQYARERLDATGDADQRRRLHAMHYVRVTEERADEILAGSEPGRAEDATRSELHNLRAAMTWALDSDEPSNGDLALRIGVALAGAPPEVRRAAGLIAHADRLLARAATSSPDRRAGILAGMATDALMLHGDPVSAEDLARRALAGGPTSMGALTTAYMTLSMCAGIAGDHERQREILLEGQQATAQAGADSLHRDAFFEILFAACEGRRGDLVAARSHAEEAVRLARDGHFPMRTAQALTILGLLLRADDPDAAERALIEGAEFGREYGGGFLARALITRAELRVVAGDARQAFALLGEALDAWDGDLPAVDAVSAMAAAVSALADSRSPHEAAVLAGALTSGPHSRVLSIFLVDRTAKDLARLIDRLRTALGSDAYDTEAARGAAMSSDEAVRFLRQCVDAALAPRTAD
jgi:predicted ATPase/class 3 adenylate cyclase